MTIELWLTFVITAVGAVFIPGPGVLLTVAHSLEYGARRTLGTIVGCLTANIFHQTLVAAGVGGLVVQHRMLLDILRYFGAAYLIYLGIRQIVRQPPAMDAVLDRPRAASSASLFFQGFSVMAMNPRSFVFFLAFFPLFLDHTKPIAAQFVMLGLTFTMVGATALLVYATSAARLRSYLANRNPGSLQRMIGILLVLSGLWFGLK